MDEKVRFDLYVMEKMQRKMANARRRGIEFNMTFQAMKNICRAKRCYYTGLPLTKPRSNGEPLRATDMTIERIDASKPYEKGNVVAVCHAANQLKSHADAGGLSAMIIAQKMFTKVVKRMKEAEK